MQIVSLLKKEQNNNKAFCIHQEVLYSKAVPVKFSSGLQSNKKIDSVLFTMQVPGPHLRLGQLGYLRNKPTNPYVVDTIPCQFGGTML